MPEPEPIRPNDNKPLGRFSKNTALIAGMLLLFVMATSLIRNNDPASAVTYTEFRAELSRGNVHKVTVSNREIDGEFRAPFSKADQEITRFQLILPGEITDGLIEDLEAEDVIIDAKTSQPSWGQLLLSALPWLLFIAFWIWIFRTMQGGGNRAFQFGRSKAKLISPDTPKVTFADVAGADEAKQELEEIIEFLKDPSKFSRLGGRLPTGVLLVGPPGTGKTLLARAVAGEAGRPFFQMSGSDFVEMFVGVGASRVRDLFEQGKEHAPCIIFVDEIDAVGRHRGAGLGGGHDEREQTLNALLVEMDGFETNEGVILLAATNRPDVLDPALLRPGRFDRQIVVDAPDVKGREGILRIHAKKLPLSDDVELALIARGTPGMSGADLENICNEAALHAARRDAEKVSMKDFEQAKDKVMFGTERRSLVLTENERQLTAYHEAGHVVLGVKIPGLDPVYKVSIIPRGRALGITASLPEEDRHSYTKEWMEGQLAMLFGGRVAEEIIFGPKDVTTGAGNDIERATAMARKMVMTFGMSDAVGLVSVGDSEQEVFLGRELGQRRVISEHTARLVDEEVKCLLDTAHKRAHEVLKEHGDLLESVAQALLERETLGREEIEALERGEALPPQPVPASEEISTSPPDPSKQPEKAPPSLGLPGADGPLPGPATSFYEAPDHNKEG